MHKYIWKFIYLATIFKNIYIEFIVSIFNSYIFYLYFKVMFKNSFSNVLKKTLMVRALIRREYLLEFTGFV